MASFRYLEFDSTYRDRNQYAEPASFVIEIAGSAQKTRETAKDPVSKCSPELYWNSSFDEQKALTQTTFDSISTNYSPTAGNTVIIVCGAVGYLRQVNGYYDGAVMKCGTTLYRIIDYSPISTVSAELSVSPSMNTVPGGPYVIQNPTNDTSTVDSPQVFIPSSIAIDNYYNGYYIQRIDTTTSPPTYETKKIISFDSTTHLATIDSNTTTSWNNANYNFIVRKELPLTVGNITDVNGRAVGLAVNSPTGNLAGNFLRMTMPVPTAPSFSTETLPYGEERKIVSYITGDGIISNIGVSSFTLNTLENTDFTGCFITDTSTYITRYISTYNTITKSGTVSMPWGGGANGDSYSIRTVFLASAFRGSVFVGDSYEVEGFSYDNWNPFSYIGTLVSSQEMVCYEVELINLVLPNLTLTSGRGGRPVFYPYFYVELQNVSAPSSRSNNIIYSNNPNSTKMLFRALVNDTPTPLISPFIKIDGDGMTHTVKFKPNDTFKFAVYHANGDLFKTASSDTYSPEAPNPLVQISACFSFKRI